MKDQPISLESLYTLELKVWWQYFKSESFAFKMICLYLFVEYVRPQSIFTWLDFLPWAQLFVLGSLVGIFMEKDRKWVASPINKWMVLFFLSILWSTLNAHYPEVSYTKLADFYTWFIIYFLIINIVTTPQRLLFFLAIFCIASFKLSFSLALTWAKRGFSFASWGLSGPSGFFQNSGELAIQMAVFWPIGLAVALSLKPYLPKWKYRVLILMPITACMVILGASSRGGQLAMAAQFFLRFFKQIFKFKVLFGIIVVVTAGWHFLPEEQKQRFAEAGTDKTSQQRLLYWENGYQMMNDYPLTGVGYYNFRAYFEDYYAQDMLYPRAELPHNIFIQVGADLGYVGLFFYLMLILCAFLALSRIGTLELPGLFGELSTAFKVSMLGFIIAGQFVSVVYYPFLWIHLAIISALYTSKEFFTANSDSIGIENN